MPPDRHAARSRRGHLPGLPEAARNAGPTPAVTGRRGQRRAGNSGTSSRSSGAALGSPHPLANSAASGTGTEQYDLGQAAWRFQLVKAIGERPAEWDLLWDEDDQVLWSRDAESEDYKQNQVGQVPRGLRREFPLVYQRGGCAAEQRRCRLGQAVEPQRLELDPAIY